LKKIASQVIRGIFAPYGVKSLQIPFEFHPVGVIPEQFPESWIGCLLEKCAVLFWGDGCRLYAVIREYEFLQGLQQYNPKSFKYCRVEKVCECCYVDSFGVQKVHFSRLYFRSEDIKWQPVLKPLVIYFHFELSP
jgi:hypothetical protein